MRDTFEFENGPTISGVRVGTTEEAKYVLQQVLAGHLPEYRERLGHNGPTPNAGEVYVHNRHLINRWTDSLSWGTSRTRKGFRVYDAKNSNLTRKTLTVSPDDGKTRWQIVAYDYQNEVSCTADRHGVPLRSVKHRVPELLSRPAGVHRESVHPPLHSMPTGIYLPALASHTPPDSPLPLTPMDSPPPPAAHHDMFMVLDDEDDTSSERDSRGEQLIALPPLSALPQPLPHHPHHYHLHPKSPSPPSPPHFHLLPPPASGLHPLGSGAPPSSIRNAYDSAVIARFPL